MKNMEDGTWYFALLVIGTICVVIAGEIIVYVTGKKEKNSNRGFAMKRLEGAPKKDGFRMPGQFEPHEGCWIPWPEWTDNWRLGAKPAQEAFVKVAEAISQFEPVTVGVSARQYDNAAASLPADIRVVEISSDDSRVGTAVQPLSKTTRA